MALLHRIHSWQQWIEPWYLAYALVGVTIGGIAPILLPLEVASAAPAATVGLVMSALGLGELAAALCGDVADRYRWHRAVFVGGALVTALAFVGFPMLSGTAVWIGLGLLIGLGTAATNTISNLLIVEVHPQDEWDTRIGWLQTFYNGGLVCGLLLAGVLSGLPLQIGLLTAAGLTALAVVVGCVTMRTPARALRRRPVRAEPALHSARLQSMPQRFVHHLQVSPAWVRSAPHRLFHYLYVSPRAMLHLAARLRSQFVLLLAIWLLCNIGPAAVYALYPVLMQQVFGIPPGPSSFALAASAAVGIALYSPSGVWAHRIGATRLLQVGLVVRLAALLLLLGLGVSTFDGRALLALPAFIILDQAWSLLSVSGTVLASRLASRSQGEGMGLFNTAAALASLVGAAIGGWVAQQAGYNAVWAFGIAGVGGALLLAVWLRPARRAAHQAARVAEQA
jgi:predicted MFS family arabinose efflux permease